MSKEAFYFSHDYNARNDPKLMRVKMKYGMEGVGIYWCLIEMLYEQNGHIPLINIESIAYELHSECERIKSILTDFDLFAFDSDFFYSSSIIRRLDERNEKSEGARQSALKRWYPDKYNDANAMRTQCDSNARKGKERKEEERKEDNSINVPFETFWNLYNKKVGAKSKCEKKWNKLTDATRKKIIDTLPDFISSIKDKQFQPYPETYLNQERWNDEIKIELHEDPIERGMRELDAVRARQKS